MVCLGLLGGAVVGAVCGFAIGFLLDSALLQTLGVSSLVLLTVGYLAGRYREGFEISNPLVPPLLAGALTPLAAGGFAAIQLMLGVDAPVSLLVLREIVVQALLAFAARDPVLPADPPGPAPGARRRLRRARGRRRPIPPARRARAAPASAGRRLRRAAGASSRDVRRPRATPDAGAVRPARRDPGGFALVMFSIIFFRLWYLQVLSGDKYLKQAQNNQVREIKVQAPRGEILDRDGNVLVDNRTALALQLEPTSCPPRTAARARIRRGWAEVIGMSPERGPQADPPADQGAAGQPGDAQARRRLRPRLLPAGEPGRATRGSPSSASTCATIRRGRSGRTSSATCARSARTSSRSRATRA